MVPRGNKNIKKGQSEMISWPLSFSVLRDQNPTSNLNLITVIIVRYNCHRNCLLARVQYAKRVYTRYSIGCADSSFIAWSLLMYTYYLSKYGRIWQLIVENWLTSMNLCKVPWLYQLLTNKAKSDKDVSQLKSCSKTFEPSIIKKISSPLSSRYLECLMLDAIISTTP